MLMEQQQMDQNITSLLQVDLLVSGRNSGIAGGGGGGVQHGGGGGAGALYFNEELTLSATTYPITIGNGGSGGTPPFTIS